MLNKIDEILEAPFANLGVDIISISMHRLGKTNILQVLIDKQDGNNVSIDDCIECNKIASVLLDVDDIIDGKYNLEISSAGENRPIVKLRDFRRFTGEKVKVELNKEINNRKRFKGIIDSVLEHENGDVEILFKDIENENKDDSREMCVKFEDIKKCIIKRIFEIKK